MYFTLLSFCFLGVGVLTVTIKQNYSEFHETEKEENCNWFKLKQNYVDDLSSQTSSYEEKVEILKNFITEVEGVK